MQSFSLIPLFFVFFAFSESAFALPTPDTLFSVGQVFLLVLSTLFTFTLGVFLRLKRGLANRSAKQLQNWTFGLGFLCILQAGGLAYLSYSDWSLEQQRVVDLYYRSDLALDAVENEAQSQISEWFSSKALTGRVLAKDVRNFVKNKNPHLLFVNRSKLGYSSGAPGFILPGGPRVFDAIYPSEVEDYLKQLLMSSNERPKRPLLFISIKPFTRIWAFSKNSELASLLKKFPGVYYIEYPNSSKELFNYFIKNPSDQDWIETGFSENDFSFPVRKENWFVNKKEIAFPNITKLITPRDCAAAFKDPSVQILLPFDSLYRPELLVSYYLGLFFIDSPEIQSRITTINWSGPRLNQTIKEKAEFLQGKPFLIAGLSKHDWIYMGLDVAYATYKNSPNDFQYLGACPWLAESAALNSQAIANRLSLQKKMKMAFVPYTLTVNFFKNLVDYSDRFFNFSPIVNIWMFGLLASIPFLLLLQSATRNEEFERQLKKHIVQNPLEVWTSELDYRFLLVRLLKLQPKSTTFLHFFRITAGAIFYPVGTYIMPSALSLSSLLTFCGIIAIRLSVNKVYFTNRNQEQLFSKRTIIIGLAGAAFFGSFAQSLSFGGTLLLMVLLSLQFIYECLLLSKYHTSPLQIFPSFASAKPHPVNPFVPLSIDSFDPKLIKGGKARNLIQLSRHPWMKRKSARRRSFGLFSVARGWVCPPPFNFFDFPTEKGNLLVVRSSASLEDTSKSSGAGQFLTLLNVDPSTLPDAIERVQTSFMGNGEVLIQEQQEMDLSGVLFTKSIDNPGTMQIDWAESDCSEVVEGKAKINTFFIGRFTGKSVQPGPEVLGSFLLNRLFLVGKALESYFDGPQDIEWGYQKETDVIVIFQSRPITNYRFPSFIELEQNRVLNLFVQRTGSDLKKLSKISLKPSDSDEVVKNPSPLLLDILERVYSIKGSFGAALKELGKPVPKDELFITCMGQLLQIETKSIPLRFSFFRRNHKYQKLDSHLRELEKLFHDFSKSFSDIRSEQEVLTLLRQGFKDFIDRVYPHVFAVSLFAKEAFELEPGIRLNTKAEELNRDLVTLSIAEIQSKWPHRGPQEYDPLAESFGTSTKLVESSRQLFKLWDASSPVVEDPNHPVVLREEAKDWALRYLHICRLLLQRLQKQGFLPPDQIKLLRLNDFFKGSFSPNQHEVKYPARFRIPRTVGFLDIEHLFFERRHSKDRKNSEITQLKCIGAELMLKGSTYPLDLYQQELPPVEAIPAGVILVVPYLDPSLAAYFGRVQGFLSVSGGSLSHLAIIGRENGVPIYCGSAVEALLTLSQPGTEVRVDVAGNLLIGEKPNSSREVA